MIIAGCCNTLINLKLFIVMNNDVHVYLIAFESVMD